MTDAKIFTRDLARYVFGTDKLMNSTRTGNASHNTKDKTKAWEKLDPIKISAIQRKRNKNEQVIRVSKLT